MGSILVKELVMIDKAAQLKVSAVKMRSLPYLRCDTKLYDMLHLFQTGRCACLHSFTGTHAGLLAADLLNLLLSQWLEHGIRLWSTCLDATGPPMAA